MGTSQDSTPILQHNDGTCTFIWLNLYAQPSAILYGLRIISWLSEHPKSDQNLKFLLLKVTTSITRHFHMGIKHTITEKLHRFEIHSSLKLSRTGFIRLPPRILASSRRCSLAITYFYLQWTPDNSNLQGKSSFRELEENSRE